MRHASLAGLLTVLLASSGISVGQPKALLDEAVIREGLEVHEWGVFTAHNDLEMANADMRAEWASLPKKFYGQADDRDLPERPFVLSKKPVIFFHTPESLTVELRIDFPGGAPAVWWPATTYPALDAYGNRPGVAESKGAYRYLEWSLRVQEPDHVEKEQPVPKPPQKGAAAWITMLRDVDARTLVTRSEGERFVYYDGLVPMGERVRLAVDKDRVSIANPAGHPVFDVTVVDRRVPERARLARVKELAAQAKGQILEFEETEGKEWSARAATTLVNQLKATGLFEDEARALANVWEKEFFGADGLTLFYRIPQDEYERLLPLKMKPRPERLVRVGLAHQPHCEPDFAERIDKIARSLDSDDFETRERAQGYLKEMGRAAFVRLRKLRETAHSADMQRRLDDLLDSHDAAKAIGQ
jgi:hypothetical protein